MLLNKNISNTTYVKFIQYALNTSDAFMLVVKYCDAIILDAREMLDNISLSLIHI